MPSINIEGFFILFYTLCLQNGFCVCDVTIGGCHPQHPCTDELIISETTCPNAKLRECRVRTQTSDSMFFKLRRLSLLIRTETLVQERGALRRGRLALGNAGLRLMSGQCFLSLLEIQTFHKPSSISQTRLALSLAESRVLVVPFSIRKKS